MIENIDNAERRGVVDYAAAERLRHVIHFYEDSIAGLEALDEVRSGLELEIEDLPKLDASEFDVDVGGTLDDLELSAEHRRTVDAALEKANKANQTAIELHFAEATDALKALLEKFGTALDDVRGAR
jgi:hypothetical protein